MKILSIALKDLLVLSRDRAALLMMLLAPFLLTLAMGIVAGGFSDGQTGIGQIPITIIDYDSGQTLSTALINLMKSEQLADLVNATVAGNEEEARRQVEADEIAAVVIIPAGFSTSFLPNPETGSRASNPPQIEIYSNPARPVSGSIIEAIVTEFLNQVDTNIAMISVTIEQLDTNGLLDNRDTALQIADSLGSQMFSPDGNQITAQGLIDIKSRIADSEEEEEFNPLARLAPGMAIFFLMYTVTVGGRTILAEKEDGTLTRLLATPTRYIDFLLGKVVAVFLSGVIQVAILIVSTALLFDISWGSIVGVTLLIITTSAAATGWGIVITAFARSAQQVSAIGSAAMLLFGILGGTFIRVDFSTVSRLLSYLTPNSWALNGFTQLGLGGSLTDISESLLALSAMTVALLCVAAVAFSRKDI